MNIVAYKTKTDLEKAIKWLTRRDPLLREVYKTYGMPDMRKLDTGFKGLVRLLISQQLSTAAAATIQARFVDLIGGEVTPEAYIALDDKDINKCGLSRPKMRYMRTLAESCLAGEINFTQLHRRSDEEIYEELTSLLGIGAWTAECYLLFALRRADIFPAGDLALQEAYRVLYKKRTRPDPDQLMKYAQGWRPYRGAAARLLWLYYNEYKQVKK